MIHEDQADDVQVQEEVVEVVLTTTSHLHPTTRTHHVRTLHGNHLNRRQLEPARHDRAVVVSNNKVGVQDFGLAQQRELQRDISLEIETGLSLKQQNVDLVVACLEGLAEEVLGILGLLVPVLVLRHLATPAAVMNPQVSGAPVVGRISSF